MADSLEVFPGGTFARAEASYLQTMFIVSRFSSLSGCLNSKLRRFTPGLHPLYRGFFILAACGAWLSQPLLQQVAAILDALSRYARKEQRLTLDRGGDRGEGVLLLHAGELVCLG